MPINVFKLNGRQFPPVNPVVPSKLTKQGSTTYSVPGEMLFLKVMVKFILELSTGLIIPISGRIEFEELSASPMLTISDLEPFALRLIKRDGESSDVPDYNLHK